LQKECKLARHATDGCENDNADDADAAAPGLMAEVEALRRRLAALEARLPGNARKDPSRRLAKRQIAVGLTAGAALALVAGASAVYAQGAAQSVADALFISRNGNIGIGTSTPAAKLQVAGSGWFGPDSGALDAAAGAGVRVFQDGANGALYSWDYQANAPRNLVLQQAGGNVGIGKLSPNDKFNVDGSARMADLNVDGSARIAALNVTGIATTAGLNVTGDATIAGLKVPGLAIDGKNVLQLGAGVKDKEANAGKIGYEAFTADALDIVGAGTTNTNRKIKLWAEGGATLTGSLNVSGTIDGNMKVVYQRDDEPVSSYEKPLWRYHMSLTAAKYGGKTKTIPPEILTKLCGTRDGCQVGLGMTRWDADSKTQTASEIFRFYYSPTDGHWRSSNGWEGVIGDGHRQDAANAWNTCYFTDTTFDKYQELGDKKTGMQLLVWNGNSNPARTCELTLIP
jgi:hypothetical protein